jgi:Arc-like DNA binding domain
MVARKLTDVVQVNLRLRESLRRKLEREAEKRGLSFNAELTRRLEEGFEREELNDAIRAVMWQVLRDGGLSEAIKPLIPEILRSINLSDGLGRGHFGQALGGIEGLSKFPTQPESKSQALGGIEGLSKFPTEPENKS